MRAVRGGRLLARALDGGIMVVVAAVSFLLMVYVGHGEAGRTYPRFLVDKLEAQGALVQSAVEPHLRAGLPLREFPGFLQIAEPILGSDATVAAIAAWDATGTAFAAGDRTVPRLVRGGALHLLDRAPDEHPARGGALPETRTDAHWLQVAVPLRNRFEEIGEVTVTMPRSAVAAVLEARLPLLASLALGLAVAFGFAAAYLGGSTREGRLPWLGIVYSACFAVVSGAVIAVLVGIYADGAQARAKAMADSLAQRLMPIVAFGLSLDDLEGLDRTFDEYRALNPDLRAAALIADGRVAIHTDRSAVGLPWQQESDTFEYRSTIGRSGEGSEIRVAVALPTAIVWNAVARSVKNFAALFVASGLLAGLFLQLGHAASRGGVRNRPGAELEIVRPIFFVAVFVESLAAGFLPQTLRDAAVSTGGGEGAASIAFTLYFVCFLVVLLPAGHAADRRGGRWLIAGGAILVALAWLLPALAPTFPVFLGARALAGIGQGALFIGVQALALAHAPPGQRTQAAAIIVFGFNGGMISGAAIGSLLVADLAPSGVFAIGAAAAALLAAYSLAFLRNAGQPEAATGGFASTLATMLRNVPRALGSAGFLRALVLIGIPSKAILTGIVGFALPLVMAGMGYPPEDIGQVIMLYAAGVLLASGRASKLVDRTGSSGAILAVGGIAAGLALVLVGLSDQLGGGGQTVTIASTAMLAAGTFVLGLAHGCINAPIITHVADSSAAERLGGNTTTALYRMLERAGHVLGPVLAAPLLAVAYSGAEAIMLAGIAAFALAAIFALTSRIARG